MQDILVVPMNGGFVNRGTPADPDFREPRTFSLGERFVAQCRLVEVRDGVVHSRMVAFKPVALSLSEAHVPANAWRVHDVRVNGRSQLDGDELGGDSLSGGSQRFNRAIASGFDTIAVGGALEVEVSLRTAGSVGRAPFYAGLLGYEVDPGRDVTAYSGSVRLRGAYGELVAATCDGPARVPPGETAWFVARPTEQALQPEQIAIDRGWADWLVEDLHIDGRTQLSQAGTIPGDCFHPDAVDGFARFHVLPAARPLAIQVRYVGSDPRGGRFGAVVHGIVVA